MKRLGIISIFILITFSFCFLRNAKDITANAEEEIKERLEKEVNENVNSLITPELERYFNNLEINFSSNFATLIKDIIDGKQEIGIDTIFNLITDTIKKEFKSTLLAVLSILVLSLLSSLTGKITIGLKKEGTNEVVRLAIYGSIICTLSIMIGNLVSTTTSAINSISQLIDLTFPILITLLTALGGGSSVALLQPFTVIFANFIVKTVLKLIIPLFIACIIFTFVGNLGDSVKLDKFARTVKSVCNWTLGITFSIITMLISIQGLVGNGIDTITLKSAKFALSSYVPILGGYLSEGFDIILASCVLIKNALGFSVFIILLSIIVVPLLKILSFSFTLKIVASIIEPIGESKLSNLVYSTASHLNVLLTALAGVFFVLFVILLIIISSFNGGVI